MELQLATSENPRRLLRHGSCAFSQIYRAYVDSLPQAKVISLIIQICHLLYLFIILTLKIFHHEKIETFSLLSRIPVKTSVEANIT